MVFKIELTPILPNFLIFYSGQGQSESKYCSPNVKENEVRSDWEIITL